MSLTTKQKRELGKFIRGLAQIKGRHTELVSVYVPAGYDLNKIINHLQQEAGTASNIKDAKTRKNVIDSLEKAIHFLRLYKKTPENGLAIFAGNVAAQEGKTDLKVWGIEPPEPIKTRIYRCDQYFLLELLEEMLEYKEVYGLIVLDRREATLGFLRGTNITSTVKMTSGVPGKFKAGGQSSQRFERLIEGMARDFFKRIADAANKEFLGRKDLKGIIIGGPGPTKEDFLDYFNEELKRKIVSVEDITYTDESGLHDLVDKARNALIKETIAEEKKILEKFLTMLAKEPGKVAYGEKEVKNALEMGVVETLLLLENLDDIIIEKLETEAVKFGSEVKIISTDTRESVQLRELGGIAAILRYPIK